MFPKQSKRRVKSSRRAAGFERSEKPAARRPARDRPCLGLQQTVTERDPRRPSGSQSEQSLGPPLVLPAAAAVAAARPRAAACRTKLASPHLQDRNPSMEGSSLESSATQSPVTLPPAFVGIDL